MKAVICPKYGSPEVLELREIEKPIPKKNELLVKVYASTVNRTDHAALKAIPFLARLGTGLTKPKKPILGTEFAGQVDAIGNEVTEFKIGDKVFGFKDSGLSTYAEYLTISENGCLTLMPEKLRYAEAAPSFEGAHYAYNFINKVELKSGQKVLVNGGTGGIGSAAVQLLKHFGANITAVCEGKDAELVKSLGAEKVIDYTKEDFTKLNETFDYVFDTVGKSSFSKCKPILNPNGVYISSELGKNSQNIFLALLTPIFSKKKVKFPLPVDIKGSIKLIKRLIEEGKFKAVVDKIYSLEETTEAFKYVEKGQKKGNVVINVVNENQSK